MPWDIKGVMALKEDFVLKVKEGRYNLSQLCREYGISRPTAYKWLARYDTDGSAGLFDRSRRPLHAPLRTEEHFIDIILSLREKYPAWGARKLRHLLLREGVLGLPSEATFNRILQNYNKIHPKESEKRQRFIRFEKQFPNELWQMDFKGYFETVEGRCFPLTILDDCSRFSLCLKACPREDILSVRTGLEKVFREYGLPEAMTMDNGSPWKGSPGQRLSTLTVWLMRLGIKVGHSRPYHPQTQGKDERFHRTLKEELLKYHNFKNLAGAQEAFEGWRQVYNQIRPHEALGMQCPAEKYRPSDRHYPEQLPAIEYRPGDRVVRVSVRGGICVNNKDYFVGECLRGEHVAVRRRGEKRWDIYYVNTWLGSVEKV